MNLSKIPGSQNNSKTNSIAKKMSITMYFESGTAGVARISCATTVQRLSELHEFSLKEKRAMRVRIKLRF